MSMVELLKLAAVLLPALIAGYWGVMRWGLKKIEDNISAVQGQADVVREEVRQLELKVARDYITHKDLEDLKRMIAKLFDKMDKVNERCRDCHTREGEKR